MQSTHMFRKPLFLASSVAAFVAVVSTSDPARADDARLDAAYPMSAPSRATFAGFALDRISVLGLHVRTRDDHTPSRGGITLSFAGDHDDVQVVVRLCVARDATEARAFTRVILRGVSNRLAPSTADEVAFADGNGKGDLFLVATRGNLAYSVSVVGGSTSAAAIAETVKRSIANGPLTFPSARATLPSSMPREGTALSLTIPANTTHHVHASGGYVTRSREGLRVRPFGAGPVEVTTIVSDGLGRVTETTATSLAR